jgi:hypothetical protein
MNRLHIVFLGSEWWQVRVISLNLSKKSSLRYHLHLCRMIIVRVSLFLHVSIPVSYLHSFFHLPVLFSPFFNFFVLFPLQKPSENALSLTNTQTFSSLPIHYSILDRSQPSHDNDQISSEYFIFVPPFFSFVVSLLSRCCSVAFLHVLSEKHPFQPYRCFSESRKW